MDYITTSEKVLPGFILHLYYEKDSALEENNGYGSQYRLLYLEKGSGSITVNNQITPFIAPSLLCLTEEEMITSVSAKNITAHTLYFKPEVINSKLTLDIIKKPSSTYTQTEGMDLFSLTPFRKNINKREALLLGPNNEIRIKELIRSISKILKDPVHNLWPCLARSYFIEILNFIQRLDSAKNGSIMIDNDHEIKQVISFINANYQEKITIPDITERFCIDRTTLSKRFQQMTGSTIIEYINKLRINISMLMLRDTTLPISDIMYRVGFNDSAHFSKTFRSNTKMPPSEYRKTYTAF